MAIFQMLPPWANWGLVLLFILWAVKLWKNHRRATKEYPDTEYIPSEGAVTWAWANPPVDLDLKVSTSDDCSRVALPSRLSNNEAVLTGIGVFLAGLGVWLLIRNLLVAPDRLVGSMWAFLGLAGVGWLFVNADTPIVSIERTPGAVIIITRYAIWLKRRSRFSAQSASRLQFAGKLQGVAGMNLEQLDRLPDYYLFVHRKLWFSRRFMMRCNPSQGSWIVGGLNQWLSAVSI